MHEYKITPTACVKPRTDLVRLHTLPGSIESGGYTATVTADGLKRMSKTDIS
jgi:hypothetical protein